MQVSTGARGSPKTSALGRFLPLVKGSSQLPDLGKNSTTFAIAYSHSCESEGGEKSPPRGKLR